MLHWPMVFLRKEYQKDRCISALLTHPRIHPFREVDVHDKQRVKHVHDRVSTRQGHENLTQHTEVGQALAKTSSMDQQDFC